MGRWTDVAREAAEWACAALLVAVVLGIPWLMGWMAMVLAS